MSGYERQMREQFFEKHPGSTVLDWVLASTTWNEARWRARATSTTRDALVRAHLSRLYREQRSLTRRLIRAEREAMIAAQPGTPRGFRDAALLSQRAGRDALVAMTVLDAQRTPEMMRWLSFAGITDGLVIRSVRKGRVMDTGIEPATVRRIIVRAADLAGIPTTGLTGGSLR